MNPHGVGVAMMPANDSEIAIAVGRSQDPDRWTVANNMESKFSICVRWAVANGGARSELPTNDRGHGQADTEREALIVADRLMDIVCAVRGGGAAALIERTRDGDLSLVCNVNGLEPGSGIPWDAMMWSDKCSRSVLGRKVGGRRARKDQEAEAT